MRKFLALVLVALILLIGNFSFWFLHTRTISGFVEALQKQLLLKGVEFSYKEIKFTNFLSWNVKAVIEEPSIKYGPRKYQNIKKMGKIDITSQPLSDEIKIVFPTEIESFSYYNNREQKLLTKFQTQPYLKVDLFNSLSTLENAIINSDIKYENQIKEILYFNAPFQVIDKENGDQTIYSGDIFTFWVVNKHENDVFSSGIKMSLANLSYNPNYTPSSAEAKEYAPSAKELGNININLDALLTKTIQTSGEKGSKSKKRSRNYDTYKLDIKNFRANSELFGTIIEGTFEKTPTSAIPFFDLSLYIINYQKLIEFYANAINVGIDNLPEDKSAIPFKLSKITDEQVNSLSEILHRLSVNTEKPNDILLKIVRNQDGEATISGKPVMLVFQQLQALFFGNLSSKHNLGASSRNFSPKDVEAVGDENIIPLLENNKQNIVNK